MSLDRRLDELLNRWEELRDQGHTPMPAELCKDAPELLPALQQHIEQLEAVNHCLGQRQGPAAWQDEPTPMPEPYRRLPHLPGFEMLEELRRGGMAIVYKARDLKLDRVVAIKITPQYFDPALAHRFRAETRTLRELRHPHIVEVFEVGEHQGQLFFAMEFMAGGNLSQRLQSQPYAPREAAELMKTVAQAVQVAHDRGIIHRDLKPSNLLLTDDGTIKIADFGLAKDLRLESTGTQSGEILGSPGYIPPEMAQGKNKEVSAAVDVYGLGATLYELLCGRPTFVGDDPIHQAATEDPEPPSRWREGIPPRLEKICLKCLSRRPEDRYPSAQALADALDAYLRNDHGQEPPRRWWQKLWGWLRGRR